MSSNIFDRIPYDVFGKIILYSFTRDIPLNNEHTSHLPLLLPPIVASHVCQSWRNALIADPLMWTYLCTLSFKEDGIMEFLRRSVSAKLNVSLQLGVIGRRGVSDSTQRIVSSLFRHMHRFKLLRIHIFSSIIDVFNPFTGRREMAPITQQVLSYVQKPAPQLETFSFHYQHVDPPLQDFSRTLFSGNAPKLNYIHCQLSLDIRESRNPLFHNLTALSLGLRDSCRLDSDRFLDFLALSPRLEYLRISLDQTAVMGPYFEYPPNRKIVLPGLQRLVLKMYNTHDLVDFLLEYVIFPSDLKWHITFRNELVPDDPPNPLSPLLSTTPFKSLSIHFGGHGQRAKMSLEEDHVNQMNGSTIVWLHDDLSHLMPLWDASLMRSINLVLITRLVLEFEDSAHFSRVIFPTIIVSLKCLQSLTVKYTEPFGPDYYPSLTFLLALTSDMEKICDSQYSIHPLQKTCDSYYSAHRLLPTSNLIWVDLNAIIAARGSSPQISLLPCLYLRELIVDVKNMLQESQKDILRKCSHRRYEQGYPLKVLVRYPHEETVLVDSPF